MKNNSDFQRTPIDETAYAILDRERTRTRKYEQYHGRCHLPKKLIHKCSGNCDGCQFHHSPEIPESDLMSEDMTDDAYSPIKHITDSARGPEEIVCDQSDAAEALAWLDENIPELRKLGELRQQGLCDNAIAQLLGIPRTTLLSRVEKARRKLSQCHPNVF